MKTKYELAVAAAERKGMERAAVIMRNLASDNKACDHWHPDKAAVFDEAEAAIRAEKGKGGDA